MAGLTLVRDGLEDVDLTQRVRHGARDVALAFRVMREARVLGALAQARVLARVAPAVWASYNHPGPWSASLEPRTVLFAGEPVEPAAGPARPLAEAPLAEVLSQRADIHAIVTARAPGLAAVAEAGLSLSAVLPGGETVTARRGEEKDLLTKPARAAATYSGAQAVLLSDQRLVALSGGGVLAAAELVIALEEAAQIQIQTALLRQGVAR